MMLKMKQTGLNRTIGGWVERVHGITIIYRRVPGGWVAIPQGEKPLAASKRRILAECRDYVERRTR